MVILEFHSNLMQVETQNFKHLDNHISASDFA